MCLVENNKIMDNKTALINFTKEEFPIIQKKLQAFLTENSIEIKGTSIIKENGTIGTQIAMMKKIELVPKTTESDPEISDKK